MNLIKLEVKPKFLDDFLIWNINIAKLNHGIIALFKKTNGVKQIYKFKCIWLLNISLFF